MRRIGLWVRIFLSVHHIVTSTYVCNMAERKERFKPCLSVLFVLDQLTMDSKTAREWLFHQYCSRTSRRTHASLSPDHENEIRGLHGDIAIFVLVFFLLEVWSIFCAASSLADIFKLHWRKQTVSMVTAEFPVLMRVRACNMLLRPAKRTKFHASNMRTKEMLDDVGSNVWYCIKHVPTSSNMLSGHQTRWPNDKMLVHPTCWVVQHLSFGRALREKVWIDLT